MPKEFDIDVDATLKHLERVKQEQIYATNHDVELEKWLKHGTQGCAMTKAEYNRLNQKFGKTLTATDTLREIGSQAICPKCESKAYRDKGWNESKYARCPKCGWTGRTVTIKEYIEQKAYR